MVHRSRSGQARHRLPNTALSVVVSWIVWPPGQVDCSGQVVERELSGMRSARRGVYRIIHEIDDTERPVIVYRIDHRATAYRPR